MRTDLFDFELPPASIALRPASPRDAARMLVVQSDGSLTATDYFSPFNMATLDTNDWDFGSSSPLPGADPSSDGTVVRRHPPRQPGTVVGVASERDVLVVAMNGGSTGPGDLLALLDEHKVAGKQLHVAGDRLTLVVSRENLHAEGRVREALTARFGDRVRVDDTLGAISVVGAGINASFDNVRRGSAALTESGAAIDGIATSSFRVTWLIERQKLDEAVRLMHATFIERPSP